MNSVNNHGHGFCHSTINFTTAALTIFQFQLQTYLDIQQDSGIRIHKGTPYHFLGQVYLRTGELAYAREQFILAFVEDVLTEIQSKQGITSIPKIDNAFDRPAPYILEFIFHMRKELLEELYTFTKDSLAKAQPSVWLFPESIINSWRDYKEKHRDEGLLIPRAVEERLFHTNVGYLRQLWEKGKDDTSGKGMQELASYLFSCVDGFESILNWRTRAYEFDVVVRNLVRTHPLLSMLGEYIGVEAKNISNTISVEELNHFIHKLRLHNMRCGVIFTTKGISGFYYPGGERYGQSIQISTFNRDNVIVFDMTEFDIERIIKGENLISILLVKYEDIRFK